MKGERGREKERAVGRGDSRATTSAGAKQDRRKVLVACLGHISRWRHVFRLTTDQAPRSVVTASATLNKGHSSVPAKMGTTTPRTLVSEERGKRKRVTKKQGKRKIGQFGLCASPSLPDNYRSLPREPAAHDLLICSSVGRDRVTLSFFHVRDREKINNKAPRRFCCLEITPSGRE